MHPTKTNKGLRDIPLSKNAANALRQQHFIKQKMINSGREPLVGYENLVLQIISNKNNDIVI